MINRLKRAIINSYSTIDTVTMLVLSLTCIWFNVIAGVICLVITAGVWTYHKYSTEKKLSKKLSDYKAGILREREDMMQAFANGAPLLVCVLDRGGNIQWCNEMFNNAFVVTNEWEGIKDKKLLESLYQSEEARTELWVGERLYNVNSTFLSDSGSRMFFFRNETAREIISKKYKEERACVAIVDVDNYEDMLDATSVENRSTVAAEIDTMIYAWAKSLESIVCKNSNSRYTIIFENKYLESFIAPKGTPEYKEITLLNSAHEVKTEADFPVSVSMGIGYGEEKLEDLLVSSIEAVDLAQGRGGDQAVIRQKGGQTRYIGGDLPAVEHRSRADVRVLAHALSNLVNDADKVIIMGHARPDMDALGSAIGIAALCHNMGKEYYIVLEHSNDGIDSMFQEARKYTYSFISHEKALELVGRKTLLVMVDHHSAALAECSELIDKTENIAVIDHHRITPEMVDPKFKHIQSFSSSASEMVAEILQFSGDKGEITKFEANAMLAGIALDTQHFTTNKAGSRTFEVCGWLKRQGGDMSLVKNYFKTDLEIYQKKLNVIANAQMVSEGIIVAYTKEVGESMGVIVSQAADDLLKMRGVNCSICSGSNGKMTMVSARSEPNTLNVQVLMEKLGGGGHQNAAAVQLTVGPEEAISQVVQAMRLEGWIK